MQRLTDFKPLQRVVLPGLGDLKCTGLVVIVGPNSSGKSQLLQDIHRRLTGEPRKLVVSTEIVIEKPPLGPFLKCLEDEGYFTTFTDDAGTSYIRPNTMFLGSGMAVGQIQPSQAHHWHQSFSPEGLKTARQQSEFLNYFGRLMVTGLFLDRRLVSLTSTGVIDFDTQSPQHDLHALYLDDQAKERLLVEMRDSFGRGVWPDTSRGNVISLKVSDDTVPPSSEDRLSPRKMAAYRTIETEGDGLKSYVATCVALLLGSRPVCLIDEPELCLHPPQAYNIGKFIGRFGARLDTVTLVATHSSHLLRGILQTASHVQIVRLSRRHGAFSAYLVPASELTDALTRPTLRAEAVLDGIFAQAVIVVEADGDRAVYQAALEALLPQMRLDAHFATVGGTGGIAETARLYRTLQIPIAVVADLDMVVDFEKMTRVLQELVADERVRARMLGACKQVAEGIRNQPPEVSPEDVAAQLKSLGNAPMNWDDGNDLELKRRLSTLARAIDRMRRLKKGGVEAYPPNVASNLRELVLELRSVGLFLVPVGELEEWLADYDVPISKSNKRGWANAAAQRIREVGRKDGDVWGFIEQVARYLLGLLQGISLPDSAVTAGEAPSVAALPRDLATERQDVGQRGGGLV